MFQQIKHSFKITGVKLRLCKERYHDLTVITIISDVVAREIESERDSCTVFMSRKTLPICLVWEFFSRNQMIQMF